MSRALSNDTAAWCGAHGIERDVCGCPASEDAPDPASYAGQVAAEALRLRIRQDARALFERQEAARRPTDPFDAGLLADILARPAEPPYRVEGLIPADAGTLIVAQRKTGKTTLNLNLARALITGEDFLGRFPVRPITGRVSILNFEVSAHQLARWADDAHIPHDRLHLVNLRGRRNPFAYPVDRAALAELLRGLDVETVIVDPFGRAYPGQSQNDAGEVGAWLTDLDTFVRAEVGARDLILNAHAGWNGERTRGTTALEDWADSIITLTKGEGSDSTRFIRAIGRDVEVDEDGLDYDPVTRALTLAGSGSRRAKADAERSEALISAVWGVVHAIPGATGQIVEDTLRRQGVRFQKGAERKALAAAVERGLLTVKPGPRGAKHYHAVDPPRPSPTLPTGEPGTLPTPPLYEGGGSRGVPTHDAPQLNLSARGAS